ncbi:synaptic defective enhancer 1-like [Zingiber officinale]|uniref:synaptic defective enhancer 1-like n=1 Tax=Zingiber officinale TaxID=94328 RepID=UPI001C4D60C7|nr:synaptic defective enhancer 1-like [Zingiber officinale]
MAFPTPPPPVPATAYLAPSPPVPATAYSAPAPAVPVALYLVPPVAPAYIDPPVPPAVPAPTYATTPGVPSPAYPALPLVVPAPVVPSVPMNNHIVTEDNAEFNRLARFCPELVTEDRSRMLQFVQRLDGHLQVKIASFGNSSYIEALDRALMIEAAQQTENANKKRKQTDQTSG